MKTTPKGLTGNMLKVLALICMTIDHVGLILLPRYTVLRVIGRLAFPIFAWMIAEGCRYTRSMGKYLSTMALAGLLYQAVYTLVVGSLRMNIMLTFVMSVGLCWLLRIAREKHNTFFGVLILASIVAAFCVTDVVPLLLKGTDYSIDYGFLGVMLPVVLYLCKDKKMQLSVAGIMLCLLSLWTDWAVQWCSLLALPLLALYNGKRGKAPLKWLFYVYYPAHLVVIWSIRIFLL